MNNAVVQLVGDSLVNRLGQILMGPWSASLDLLRGLGRYLAVELILPGGTLLALLLWLYRHRVTQRRHETA